MVKVQVIRVPATVQVPPGNIAGAEWTPVRDKANATRLVPADWYSNINDAVTAAGRGGVVRLSANTTYDTGGSGDPLLLTDAVTIEGEDRSTSVINATGAAAIRTATPATQVQNAVVRNLTLDGGSTGVLGLDARFLSRCHFDLLRIQNFTSHAVWFGGDQATDIGGWSNTFWRSLVYAPTNGAALYFDGRVGASGPPTGNFISVLGNALYTKDSASSYAVHIVEGEGNIFSANDMGYGEATAVYLSTSLARRNRFTDNRMENTNRAVLLADAEYNAFTTNVLHARNTASAHHLVEITSGAYRNSFLWNYAGTGGTIAPTYYEDATGYQTHIITPELGETTPHALAFENLYRSITSKAPGDAQPRFIMTAGGDLSWGSGATAPDVLLRRYAGNPEGAVHAGPGSLVLSTNGNVYRKATGTGNTGWVAL